MGATDNFPRLKSSQTTKYKIPSKTKFVLASFTSGFELTFWKSWGRRVRSACTGSRVSGPRGGEDARRLPKIQRPEHVCTRERTVTVCGARRDLTALIDSRGGLLTFSTFAPPPPPLTGRGRVKKG